MDAMDFAFLLRRLHLAPPPARLEVEERQHLFVEPRNHTSWLEHEVPEYGLVHLLDLEEDRLEIIELAVADGSPAAGRRVSDVALPEGSLIISVLREGGGFVPKADTVIEPGDEVLVVLDPGLEGEITRQFNPNGLGPTA